VSTAFRNSNPTPPPAEHYAGGAPDRQGTPMTSRKLRFTNRTLDAVPPCPAESPSKATEYSDTDIPGLKAHVSKTGEIVFYFRFVYRQRKAVIRVGTYPATSIADARQICLDYRGKLDRGLNPKEENDRFKSMPTFTEFSADYLKLVRQYKRSASADESKIRLYLLKHFGRFRLSEISARDVQSYHHEIAKHRAPSTANRHLALLSKMFNVAVEWEILEKSPCRNVKKFKEDNQIQRFLSSDEIRRLYEAMENEPNKTAVNALKLLLLTGCRREEILKLKWENISLESSTLFLPEGKTGSRYVQLNGAAIDVLRNLDQATGPYVFPGRDGPEKPLNNPRKCFSRLLEAAGIGHVRLHDLRHTHASILVNQGVSLFMVQKILGHKNPKTTQRYSHLSDSTLRAASERVSVLVNQVTSPKISDSTLE
jgi:integrase